MSVKGQGQYRHFLKRCKERLNLELKKADYIELLNEVESRNYPTISKTPNNRKLFIQIEKYSSSFIAIYDLKYRKLVTVLTLEMWNQNNEYKD